MAYWNRQTQTFWALEQQKRRRGRKAAKPDPLTPLQQATLAAWDMQESSGPLLPAKGGIEIPAFNSPGTTTGPAAGISARDFLQPSGQYFEATHDAVFSLPSSGVKTYRVWSRYDSSAQSQDTTVLLRKAGNAVAGSAGDEFATDNTGSRNRLFIRDSDDVRSSDEVSSSFNANQEWLRLEIAADADNGEVFFHTTLLSTGQTQSTTITGMNGFQQNTLPFVIGGISGRFWHGQISLLAIFDRALTTEERTADLTPRLYADL